MTCWNCNTIVLNICTFVFWSKDITVSWHCHFETLLLSFFEIFLINAHIASFCTAALTTICPRQHFFSSVLKRLTAAMLFCSHWDNHECIWTCIVIGQLGMGCFPLIFFSVYYWPLCHVDWHTRLTPAAWVFCCPDMCVYHVTTADWQKADQTSPQEPPVSIVVNELASPHHSLLSLWNENMKAFTMLLAKSSCCMWLDWVQTFESTPPRWLIHPASR